MFVPEVLIRSQRCALPVVLYLLLCCCLVSGTQTTKYGTNLTTHQGNRTSRCKQPKLPLMVVKAFTPNSMNNTLPENNFEPIPIRGREFDEHTTIIVDCGGTKTGVFFTLVHNGNNKLTCVQPDKSINAEWDAPLPTCERNICWWLGNERGVQFIYNGRVLSETQKGFPEGTEPSFTNLECKAGQRLIKNRIFCTSMGIWDGSRSECVTDTTTVPSTTTNSSEFSSFSTANGKNISLPHKNDISTENHTPNMGEERFNDTANAGFLILACVMTAICLALFLAVGSFFIYCKFFRNDKKIKSKISAKLQTDEAQYQQVELQSATPTNGDYFSSSTKNDYEYSEIDGDYSAVRDIESPSSPTYAEPLYDVHSDTKKMPVYAVPVPKPRKTRPVSGKLETCSLDVEKSQEKLKQLHRLSSSHETKAQSEHSGGRPSNSDSDKQM